MTAKISTSRWVVGAMVLVSTIGLVLIPTTSYASGGAGGVSESQTQELQNPNPGDVGDPFVWNGFPTGHKGPAIM